MNSPDWFSTIWNTFKAECNTNDSFAANHAIPSFGKKYVGDGIVSLPLKERENAARSRFERTCDRMVGVNELIASDNFLTNYCLEDIFYHATDFIDSVCSYENRYLNEIPDSEFHLNFGVGPGASHGVKGNSWIDKLASSDLTFYPHQSSLYRYYLSGIRGSALEQVELERASTFGVRPVLGSKGAFAPKTNETERLIGTEASLPMGYQLSIHAYLSKRLRRFGLDLSDQQFKNRALARRGSIDGSLSTIDLSDASDSVSIELVKKLFKNQKGLLWALLYFRANHIVFKRGKTETVIELPMLSTMGNGYTFVIETLVFMALAIGLAKSLSVKLDWKSAEANFGVYGDDIIVPVTLFFPMVDLLTKVGFIANLDKCFTAPSPFRESCGGDYHLGAPVRPIYLYELNSDQKLYSAINRLISWSAQHDINIDNTLALLAQRVTELYTVPMGEECSSGLRVPSCLLPPDFVCKPISATLATTLKVSLIHSGATVFLYWKPKPCRVTYFFVKRQGEEKEYLLKKRYEHAPYGVLQAALQGMVRNNSSFKRNDVVRYELTFGVALWWDALSDDLRIFQSDVGYLERYASIVQRILDRSVPQGW